MKKIQTLLLALMTVFMGMTVQSCNNDDDAELYTVRTEITDRGNLPDAIYQSLKQIFDANPQRGYASLDEAKKNLSAAADNWKTEIEKDLKLDGNIYKYTVSYVVYNSKGEKVYKIDLKIDGTTVTVVK